jgi:hypothetical protein
MGLLMNSDAQGALGGLGIMDKVVAVETPGDPQELGIKEKGHFAVVLFSAGVVQNSSSPRHRYRQEMTTMIANPKGDDKIGV